jgi:hypothetical protein
MKLAAITALLTLSFVFPAPVLALGMETFGNAPAVKQPDWAEGVLDVVNLKSRVYSQWVNGNENFFYRGDAQALNEALRKYAAVKADVRQVILLPGSGKTQTFAGKALGFDWQLHVPSGIYKAMSKRTHAVMTVYISARKPGEPRERKKIEQWLRDLDSDAFETREKATRGLEKLGRDSKPLLRDALKARPNLEARRRIEALLQKLRGFDTGDLEMPKGITVVSVDELLAVHLKGLQSANSTVCAMAIQDLCTLAPYSDKVVPALTGMLGKDKNEYVRRVAAACLAQIGAKARSAVAALNEAMKDSDANIRKEFQSAIDRIEKASEPPEEKDKIKDKLSILKEINGSIKNAPGR